MTYCFYIRIKIFCLCFCPLKYRSIFMAVYFWMEATLNGQRERERTIWQEHQGKTPLGYLWALAKLFLAIFLSCSANHAQYQLAIYTFIPELLFWASGSYILPPTPKSLKKPRKQSAAPGGLINIFRPEEGREERFLKLGWNSIVRAAWQLL